MEDYLLRIVLINFNENLKLVNRLSDEIILSKSAELRSSFDSFGCSSKQFNNNTSNTYIYDKFFFLEISEELENFKIELRFLALAKLLNSFIKNFESNFMLVENIENMLNLENIKSASEYGVLNDLIKNLGFLLTKFTTIFTK
jgi:hypothetical protein